MNLKQRTGKLGKPGVRPGKVERGEAVSRGHGDIEMLDFTFDLARSQTSNFPELVVEMREFSVFKGFTQCTEPSPDEKVRSTFGLFSPDPLKVI